MNGLMHMKNWDVTGKNSLALLKMDPLTVWA